MNPRVKKALWCIAGIATIPLMFLGGEKSESQEGTDAPAAAASAASAPITKVDASEHEARTMLNLGAQLGQKIQGLTVADVCTIAKANSLFYGDAIATKKNAAVEFQECAGRNLQYDHSLLLAGAAMGKDRLATLSESPLCHIFAVAKIESDLVTAKAKKVLPPLQETVNRINNIKGCEGRGRFDLDVDVWKQFTMLTIKRFYPDANLQSSAAPAASAASGPS